MPPEDAAELSRRVGRVYFELAGGLHGGLQDSGVDPALVIVDAVHHEVVVLPALAVRVEAAGAALHESARALDVAALLAGGDAGGQEYELHIVAPVQRQILHGLLLDHLADFRAVGFHQRRRLGDGDGFVDIADGKREVEPGLLVDNSA